MPFKDYIEQVHAMHASGYLYVVKCKEWHNSLLGGVPAALHKLLDGEADDVAPIPEEKEEPIPSKKPTPSQVKL